METFTKKQSNITKGIGILLMLWHHLFFDSPEYYEKFVSLRTIHGIPVECYIASVCKVCVAIFLFLSGYGLYRSYEKIQNRTLKEKIAFVGEHLLALLLNYWFIFVLFVPAGFLFGRNPFRIYHNNFRYFMADFFGLSFLFYGWGSPTMNDTWWFMSIILIYYCIFPILVSLVRKYPESASALAALISIYSPGFHDLDRWIFPFVLGIYFSSKNLFSSISTIVHGRVNRIISASLLLITLSLLRLTNYRQNFIFVFDGLFACTIAFFCFWALSKVKPLSSILEILGIYSSMIFMFHTFIFEYYFPAFIYRWKYAPVIFIVLTVICLGIAFCLEKVKRLIGFAGLVNRLKKSY